MIGQISLLEELKYLAETHNFPRFSIIVGSRGSGKKLLCYEISKMLECEYAVVPDVSVETVRQVIATSYKNTLPTVYAFTNTDRMSLQAKNALLKITEEPPHNAYFILTTKNAENTLDTLKSRAELFYMEPYLPSELQEYARKADSFISEKVLEIIHFLCASPGEVGILLKQGDPEEFMDYVALIVDKIGKVPPSNALKAGKRLKFKEADEGYDPELFLRAANSYFLDDCTNSKDESLQFYCFEAISVTHRYLAEFGIKGINKASCFDMWLLDLRKAYRRVIG